MSSIFVQFLNKRAEVLVVDGVEGETVAFVHIVNVVPLDILWAEP